MLRQQRPGRGRKRRALQVRLLWALVDSGRAGNNDDANGSGQASAAADAPEAEDRVTRSNDYFSVILLPPLKKKEVAPPRLVPPTQVHRGNGSTPT